MIAPLHLNQLAVSSVGVSVFPVKQKEKMFSDNVKRGVLEEKKKKKFTLLAEVILCLEVKEVYSLMIIEYSYPIQIISKQIYLIFRWNPNRYHHSSSVDLGVMTMKGCLTPHSEGKALPLCRRY